MSNIKHQWQISWSYSENITTDGTGHNDIVVYKNIYNALVSIPVLPIQPNWITIVTNQGLNSQQ